MVGVPGRGGANAETEEEEGEAEEGRGELDWSTRRLFCAEECIERGRSRALMPAVKLLLLRLLPKLVLPALLSAADGDGTGEEEDKRC